MGKQGKALTMAAALVMLLLAVVLTQGAWAADEPPVVSSRLVQSQSAYPQGGTYPLALELTIRPGYHINSTQPSEPDLYPTALVLFCSQDCSLSPAAFPPAQSFKPPFLAKPIQVYEGKVLVRFTVSVAKDARPGQQFLSGRLSFQACDDTACLMPEDLDVSIPLKVVAAKAAVNKENQEIFRK